MSSGGASDTASSIRPRKLLCEHLCVLSAFTVLALFLTYPLFVLDGNTSLNPPSNDLSVVWALTHYSVSFFVTHPGDFLAALSPPILVPLDHPLFHGDHCFGNILFFSLPYFITHDPFVAAHVMILVLFVLSAYVMHLLAMHHFKDRLVAAVAGLIFGFTGYRLTLSWDLQCLNTVWLLLALLFVEKFLSTPRRRYAVLFAAAVLMQMYSYTYFFLMMCLLLPVYALLHRNRMVLFRSWRTVLGALALCVAGAVPFMVILRQITRYEYYLRFNKMLDPSMSYDPTCFAKVFETNWLYGRLLGHGNYVNFVGIPYVGDCLFPGLASIGLFIVGLGALRRMPRFPALGLLVVSAVAFSLATRFGAINGDFVLLQKLVPPLEVIRAPMRFFVFFHMGFALVGAAGLARLKARVGSRWAGALVGVVAAVIVLENTNVPFRTYPVDRFTWRDGRTVSLEFDRPTPLTKWLNDGRVIPRDEVILELPSFIYGLGQDLNADLRWDRKYNTTAHYLFQWIFHQRRLADGWTGHIPKGFRPIKRFDLGDPTVRHHLWAIGVRWIIVHDDFLPSSESKLVTHPALLNDGLAYVATIDRGRIYRLHEDVEIASRLSTDFRLEGAVPTVSFSLPSRAGDRPGIWLNPVKCRGQKVTATLEKNDGRVRSEGELHLPLTIEREFRLPLDRMGLDVTDATRLVSLAFEGDGIADWVRPIAGVP
ncbi:MAG: hypothetical protein PHU25_18100 [Deltaproteobacteria bacterium]|nr:hypothetical protein [Deltaproteobacteria bacterium]